MPVMYTAAFLFFQARVLPVRFRALWLFRVLLGFRVLKWFRVLMLFAVLIFAVAFFAFVLTCSFSFALSCGQVTIVLSDSSNDEAVGFATVSLTRVGEEKPYKYALSDSKGKAVIDRVQRGKYVLKAELMGYKNFTKEIEDSGN